MGATFYGESQEENNQEDPEEWLGDNGASSHITHKKTDMTSVEKCKINVTVGNFQKMKCELKGSVNKKLQDVQAVRLTEVLYVPQAVKIFLSVSRLVPKGATMGANQAKIIIKKNRVGMNLDASKGQKKSMMFYLKENRYSQ